MAKCNFSISFPGTAERIIDKTRNAIEAQGGVFKGDESSGSFSVQVMGSISGSYTIAGQEMNVDIDSKPLFIPCSQIESFMRSQFGK